MPFDYGPTIGYISLDDDRVNMIHVKGANTQYTVTTRRTFILEAPISNNTLVVSVSMQYNILKYLGKTLV